MRGIEPFGMIPLDVLRQCSRNGIVVFGVIACHGDRDSGRLRWTVAAISAKAALSTSNTQRGIRELRKIGRLDVHSGKAGGSASTYFVVYRGTPAAANSGRSNLTEGSVKSDLPYYNVVKESFQIAQPPAEVPTPNSNGDGFADFWKLYPVKLAEGRARREWALLTPEEKTSAADAVTILRTVYDAAADKQRGYTQHAHNWIREKSWRDDPAAIEQFYKVPGALRDSKRKAAPRQQVEPWLAGVKFQSGPPLTSGKKAS